LKISGSANVGIQANSSRVHSLSKSSDVMALKYIYDLVDRDLAGNLVYADTLSLAGDESVDLDLGNMGSDDFGDVLAYQVIYFLAVVNRAKLVSSGLASLATLQLGVTSGWEPFIPSNGHLKLSPGGAYWWIGPQGVSILTINRALRFSNLSSTAASYDLVIIGTSSD
jgi:hypothetical protein